MNLPWLVLDIGNTHTVAGLFEPLASPPQVPYLRQRFKLLKEVRYRTDAEATSDEYASQIRLFYPELGQGKTNKIERVIISSVVPSLERSLQKCFFQNTNRETLIINHTHKRNFDLTIPRPDSLGADRLANIAGALSLFAPPFVIIDAGTATTFCLLDHSCKYLGGAIAPGLEISWKALKQRASKLFSVELSYPPSIIGDTTETQIQSGVLFGYVSLIEGMTQKLLEEAGPEFTKKVTLLATGGITKILKFSDSIITVDDLTLMGLLRYGELNP